MLRVLQLRRPVLHAACFAALSAAILCPLAHALTHVTLRNGQDFDCVRLESIDSSHTRAIYSADGTSYQDFPAAEIARVETLPDPPPVIAAAPSPAAPLITTANLTPQEMQQLLVTAGTAHNIDEDLLASVIHTESGGHTKAVSHAGARGLMQLMPGTARDYGVTDAFRPEQNIAGGTAYLDALLKRYKDNIALALAAYNAGPGAVDRYHGVPPYRETRAYVARVIREFNKRKRANSMNALAASLGR